MNRLSCAAPATLCTRLLSGPFSRGSSPSRYTLRRDLYPPQSVFRSAAHDAWDSVLATAVVAVECTALGEFGWRCVSSPRVSSVHYYSEVATVTHAESLYPRFFMPFFMPRHTA